MATQQEILELILKVQGQKEAENLQKEMAELRRQINLLGISAAATDPRMMALGDQLASQGERLKELDKQFGKGSASSRDWGRSLLYASYGLEDLRFGLDAVLNNIPQLVMALGGSSGLAGVISIVAVSSKVLYDNWDKLTSAFGVEPIETASKALERLGKVLEKTSEEQRQFNAASDHERDRKEAESVGAKMRNDKGDVREAGAKGVQGAIAGAGDDSQTGFDKLFSVLKKNPELVRSQLSGADQNRIDDLKAQRAEHVQAIEAGDVSAPKLVVKVRQAEDEIDRIENKGREAIKSLIESAAATGKLEDINRLKGVIESNRAGLGGMDVNGLLAKLDQSTPEGVRADHQAKIANAVGDWFGKLKLKAVDALEKEAKKVVKENKEKADKEKKAEEKIKDDTATEYERQKKIDDAEKKANREGFDRAARSTLEKTLGTEGAAAMGRQGAMQDQIADFSGIGGRAMQLMFEARNGQAGPRNPAELRRLQRMTFEERQNMQGQQNDQIDSVLIKQGTNALLRNGYTRDPKVAEAIARQEVQRARGNLNGMTGDPDTKAKEENSKAVVELTKAVVELKSGIPMKFLD